MASCLLPWSFHYPASHPLTYYPDSRPKERCSALLTPPGATSLAPEPPWSSRDPRGCLHANPPASQIRTQGDWSEGILLGRPSGTERGMSPLPSLLTFEKDRIRRKVNVTLLFSWEPGKRKADPEFWLLQVQWWCWGAGHEVTAGWGARAGLGSCNGAFWD